MTSSVSESATVGAPATLVAYTPVASSVKALHARIASNSLLLSSLARLQAIVPTAVSERAVSAAGQAQQLTLNLASPIVTSVDSRLNSAIVGVKNLPAYGIAKVQQADQIASANLPEQLKPTYDAARGLVHRGVAATGQTVERARALKAERSQQLWNALESVQAQINSLRAALEKSGVQAREALHIQARLAELHAKVNQALLIATEKRDQARHLTNEVLASVSALTLQLTDFVENSVLSESQREVVHSLWARLIEKVNSLKQHLYPSAPASPSSSRSDSAASSVESVEAAAASAASAASEGDAAESLSEEKVPEQAAHSKKHGAKRANKHAAKQLSPQQQQDEEQKEKIAAENE